jgi:hypothetical protein
MPRHDLRLSARLCLILALFPVPKKYASSSTHALVGSAHRLAGESPPHHPRLHELTASMQGKRCAFRIASHTGRG